MKKKRPLSRRMEAALAAHDKFLRSHGIDPTKAPVLRGVPPTQPLPKASTGFPTAPTASNTVPANGTKRKASPKCDLPIAQVYHKGPLMVVTDMSTLVGSKRRG